jgi:glycolate oxidase FAD binding subunit
MARIARGTTGAVVTIASVATAAEVRDRVMEARANGTPLRVVGAGTWLDAGQPVRATHTISTSELSGIVDYVPGDLTLTARAGTTLAEIHAATGAHNQWLALDPFGSDDSTIGAVAATASAGPLATAFGTPRDLVLGVEFVTGEGVIARGGGKVVKNVAGFDLTRLLIGSWGTLGVITELSLRLHARPESEATIAVHGVDAELPGRLRTLLRRLPFKPFACEVLNAPMAAAAIGERTTTALVRLGGNVDEVAFQRSSFQELGDVRQVANDVWHRLRRAEPADAYVVRLSNLPSEIDHTWKQALELGGALLHASVARGIVRCIIPPSDEGIMALRGRAATRPDSWIGERLPPDAWALSRGMTPLAARVKQAFDPSNILNPGILGSTGAE